MSSKYKNYYVKSFSMLLCIKDRGGEKKKKKSSTLVKLDVKCRIQKIKTLRHNNFSGNSLVNQYLFFLPEERASLVTDLSECLSNYSSGV